jgi:hypothetical protein
MMFSAILKTTKLAYPANSSCPDLTKIHPALIANSLIERRKTHYLKSEMSGSTACLLKFSLAYWQAMHLIKRLNNTFKKSRHQRKRTRGIEDRINLVLN